MASKFTGRSGYVKKNGASIGYAKWSLDIERSEIDVTDFDSADDDGSNAWREFLAGFRNGRITLEGPLDTDRALLIDEDDVVTIELGVAVGKYISCPCVILKGNFSNDVNDAARDKVEARVSGRPTFVGIGS